MINALSVDLEDWYHICGVGDLSGQVDRAQSYDRLEKNTETILLLFKEYGVSATFFVVGKIAQEVPELIKKIADAGHELGAHSFSHRRIFDMTPEEFEKDLLRCKSAIEKAAGRSIYGYRTPEWSLKKNNIWALDLLKKHGFSYDASAVPLSHLGGRYFNLYPYEINTKYGTLLEFPLSTSRCFGERLPFTGGLAMRINPYFYILDCAKVINRLGYPVIFYLHPWEFDSQPMEIKLPFNRKFMRECNLESTAKKTKLLLERLEFSTIEDVLGLKKLGNVSGFLIKNHNPPHIFDAAYFKSVILAFFFILGLCLIIFSVVFLMKQYALLLPVALLTVFYWPWGLLFKGKHRFIKNE